ncbi:MAG: phosphate-starvation-inducible PsiE family protein [Lachnospiraceae bacterium]|nr:phosphate-starvation-inducible PsiE family protein [Lachnospiraceae bacterium]
MSQEPDRSRDTEEKCRKSEERYRRAEEFRKRDEAREKFDREIVSRFLLRIPYYLELCVSAILLLSIIVALVSLLGDLAQFTLAGGNADDFQTFLGNMFTVVIGIEFLKMLCSYNVDSVIEVILFTVARQLVLNHTAAFELLLSVIAIAILFVVRKYLFVKRLDAHPANEGENIVDIFRRRREEQKVKEERKEKDESSATN